MFFFLQSFSLVFAPAPAIEQSTVTIYGNIAHQKDDKVYIRYYNDYLTYEEVTADSAKLDRKGNFSMEFPWNTSYPATLYHGDEITEMYISPNDSLRVTLDTRKFDETVAYTGRGANINNYLARKTLLFPYVSGSVFKMQEKEFTHKVDSLYREELKYFNDYFSKFPDKNMEETAFMETEESNIRYGWANTKEMYPSYHAYLNKIKGPLPVSESYYDFLKEESVFNEAAIHSTSYLEFLAEHVNTEIQIQWNQDSPQSFLQFKQQYIESNLSREIRDYVMASWIYELLTETDDIKSGEQLLNTYKSFSTSKRYADVLDNALLVASRLSPGNPAPDFSCPDTKGKMVSLSDFIGKIVYLDIWATWCGPCIQEIPHAQKLAEAMKYQDVVFLCVSVDDNEKSWKKMVKARQMEGVHLISKGNFNSNVAQLYNARGIPHYVIIDKDGNIVNNKADRPSGDVKKELEVLLLPTPAFRSQ